MDQQFNAWKSAVERFWSATTPDYREVAQWNGLSDPTKISVGQQLRVKPPQERAAPPQQTAQNGVTVGAAKGAGRPEARPLDAPGQQGSPTPPQLHLPAMQVP